VSDPSFVPGDISSGHHLRLYRRLCPRGRIHGCNKNELHYLLSSLIICKAHCIDQCCFSSLHNYKLTITVVLYYRPILFDR
jgi:hypothetical protein